MRDVFEVTPPMLKESAYALGSTTWEVVWKVVLPYTKTGVVGGIMLGLGRAIGETMAVTFVIGNFNQLNSLSLFEAANSITSALANEFGEAAPGLHQASLIYLGLVLFLITFIVLSISKLLLRRLKKREGAGRMSVPALRRARPRRSGAAGACTRGASASTSSHSRWRWRRWRSASSGWSGSWSRRCASASAA